MPRQDWEILKDFIGQRVDLCFQTNGIFPNVTAGGLPNYNGLLKEVTEDYFITTTEDKYGKSIVYALFAQIKLISVKIYEPS